MKTPFYYLQKILTALVIVLIVYLAVFLVLVLFYDEIKVSTLKFISKITPQTNLKFSDAFSSIIEFEAAVVAILIPISIQTTFSVASRYEVNEIGGFFRKEPTYKINMALIIPLILFLVVLRLFDYVPTWLTLLMLFVTLYGCYNLYRFNKTLWNYGTDTETYLNEKLDDEIDRILPKAKQQ